MNKKELIRTIIVLCSSLVVLLIAFTQVGSFYARLLFPLFRWEIHLLAPEVEQLSIELEDHQGQQMVAMTIRVTADAPGQPRLSKTVTVHWPPINMYIHPIIMFSILAAWPRIAFKERVKLFGIGLLFLLLVEMLDIPLLTASRSKVHAQSLVSKGSPLAALMHEYWLRFLNNGGREFLAIFSGLLAVGVFHLFRFRGTGRPKGSKEPGRNDPCPCGSGNKYKHCCISGQ